MADNPDNIVPDAIRRILFGLHPAKWIGDTMQIPAVPSAIASLSGNQPLADKLNPEWVQGVSGAGNSLRNLVRGTLDIQDSEPIDINPTTGKIDVNWKNMLLEEGPMAIMPMGAAGTPVKVANTASRAQKVMAGVANQAVNLTVPAVQGSYKVGAPIQVAATLGIPALLDGTQVQAAEGEEVTQDTQLDLLPDMSTNIDLLPQMQEPALDLLPDEQMMDSSTSRNLGIALGIGLGALFTTSGLRAIDAVTKNKARAGLSDLAGEAVTDPMMQKSVGSKVVDSIIGDGHQAPTHDKLVGPITDPMTVVKTQTLDNQAPLTNMATKLASPDRARAFEDKLRTTINASAMGSRIRHTLTTGWMPNSKIRTINIANHFNDYGTLDAGQQAKLTDALLAQTRLDEIRAGKRTLWEGKPGTNFTQAELSAKVAGAMADPRLAKLMTDTKKMMSDFASYAHEAGVIDTETLVAWKKNNPNYIPLRYNYVDDEPNLLQSLYDTDPGLKSEVEFFRARSMEDGVRAGEAVEPFAVLPEYISKVLRYSETNRIRREAIDIMLDADPLDASGAKVIQKVGKPTSPSNDIVAISRNGKTEWYKIKDGGVASALRFSPQNLSNILNTTRRIGQQFTTGYANPAFAPVSAAYEAFSAALTTAPGRGLGPLDEILAYAKLPTLGKFDPTVHASVITGAVRQYHAQAAHAVAQALDLSVRQNGRIAQLLGPQGAQDLANVMARAYERSSYAQLMQQGGANSVWLDAAKTGKLPKLLQQVAGDYARAGNEGPIEQFTNSKTARAYKMFLEGMHNSVRLQYFASNRAKLSRAGKWTPKQKQILAAETRDLTADLSKMGGDPNTAVGQLWGRAVLNLDNYINVSMQVPARLARAAKEDPAGFSGSLALMGTGVLGYYATMSPEDLYVVATQLTPEQRMTGLPIVKDGQVVGFHQVFAPEVQAFLGMTVEGAFSAFGLKDPETVQQGGRLFSRTLDLDWNEQDTGDILAAGKMGASKMVPDLIGGPVEALIHGTQAIGYGADELMTGKPTEGSIKSMAFPPFAQPYGPMSTKDSFDPLTGENDSMAQQALRGFVDDLFGMSSDVMINTAKAGYNAFNNGSPVPETLDRVASTFTEPYKKQLSKSIGGNVLFGDAIQAPLKRSLGTHLFNSLNDKMDHIKGMTETYRNLVEHPGQRTATGGVLPYGYEDLSDTQLAVVGAYTEQLSTWLSENYQKPVNDIRGEEASFKRSSLFGDTEYRTRQQNEYTDRRLELAKEAYQMMQEFEAVISTELGRQFTFTNPKMKELKLPAEENPAQQ